MKFIKFIFAGIFFGILLTKGQVISWFRIYEMFRFQDFHMYGVIGSAVVLGAIGLAWIKKSRTKNIEGQTIKITEKDPGVFRYLIGGTIFGIGWAMTGACPGPLFALLGSGFMVFGVVIVSAMFGTFLYGILRHKLPH